jgi:hypothetical protein
MQTYIFMMRNPNGSEEQIATLTTDGKTVTWTGDEFVRNFLKKREWQQLGFKKFDETKPAHVKKLPILLIGSALWVTTTDIINAPPSPEEELFEGEEHNIVEKED